MRFYTLPSVYADHKEGRTTNICQQYWFAYLNINIEKWRVW